MNAVPTAPVDPARALVDGWGEAGPATVRVLMEVAREAAEQAAALVRDGRPERVAVAATKSSPTDVVTAMDRASERLLREVLRRHRPDDAVLGEEYGTDGGAPATGLTWIVDPIDGTVNYLYGLPAYAVSVAVVAGDPSTDGAWSPVAACVHNPATGQVWTAGLGQGAWAGPRRLSLGEGPAPEAALVATGFGYDAQRRAGQAQVLTTVLPRVRDIRRLGACAVDLCLVAEGVVDAYYERGVHAWDMAAGRLVVTEAGGVVDGLGGLPAGEAMVVAGPHVTVAALRDILITAGALDQP
ncbi:MAG: inositol monophosphatase family protein [Kineosporiaceae bacterium]